MQITHQDKKDFAAYCDTFYGVGDGIYTPEAVGNTGGATAKDIMQAINIYLMRGDDKFFYNGTHRWGGGDTVDREIVGDILVNELGIDIY